MNITIEIGNTLAQLLGISLVFWFVVALLNVIVNKDKEGG